jgi:hypothetical protein
MAGASDDIVTAAGRVTVLHRLALAVEVLDAVNRRAAFGVRVGREAPRTAALPPRGDGSGRLVLRHDARLPDVVRVRIDDPTRRWVPRRLDVPLWTLEEVRAADQEPPGAFVPAGYRLVRPWLKPGAGYPCPHGTTGVRFGVRRGRDRVAWPRIEVFDSGALPAGWAHGDERGEVLLLIAPPPAPPPTFPVVVRVHEPDRAWRDPRPAAEPSPLDPLRDLHPEPLARAPVPPAPPDLDGPAARGDAPPPGYLRRTDHLLTCTVGRIVAAADLDIA